MMDERRIIGWDAYDKTPIYEGQPYVVDGEDWYHKDNHDQLNRYNDPFGDENVVEENDANVVLDEVEDESDQR